MLNFLDFFSDEDSASSPEHSVTSNSIPISTSCANTCLENTETVPSAPLPLPDPRTFAGKFPSLRVVLGLLNLPCELWVAIR